MVLDALNVSFARSRPWISVAFGTALFVLAATYANLIKKLQQATHDYAASKAVVD
jgi:hypothetical protein